MFFSKLEVRATLRFVGVATLAAALLLTGCGGKSPEEAKPTNGTVLPKASLWGLPDDPSAAALKAGLPMLTSEQLAFHYHAHIDVIVDGQQVVLPTQIGIDEVKQRISPLHTHDERGVVHVESATNGTFTLGQLFDEWGVELTSTMLANLANDNGKTLRVYVDGSLVTDNPRNVVLKAHEQIAVVHGAPDVPAEVPRTFQFKAGE